MAIFYALIIFQIRKFSEKNLCAKKVQALKKSYFLEKWMHSIDGINVTSHIFTSKENKDKLDSTKIVCCEIAENWPKTLDRTLKKFPI